MRFDQVFCSPDLRLLGCASTSTRSGSAALAITQHCSWSSTYEPPAVEVDGRAAAPSRGHAGRGITQGSPILLLTAFRRRANSVSSVPTNDAPHTSTDGIAPSATHGTSTIGLYTDT